MNLLSYQINAKVITADGGSIPTGAISVFTPYPSNLTAAGKLPIDINFWYSLDAKNKAWRKIIVAKDEERKEIITNTYLEIKDPAKELSYDYVLAEGLKFLEGIYGEGNIAIIPIKQPI